MSDDRERRGLSLRKRKPEKKAKSSKNAPQISAPIQISGPRPTLAPTISGPSPRPSQESNRSGPRPGGPRERPQRNNTTAELVKKRYSAKITQLPADFPGNGAPMPELPKLPTQYMQPPPSRDDRRPGSSDGRRTKPDMRVLQDPNLRPDQYVNQVLVEMSESDIQQYQADLRKAKNRTSMELQHNVFQNRTQFIKISKEAEKLKGEMRTLKLLMSELTTTLGQTTSAANPNGDTMTVRKAANRSSVANLEALWNSQLHQLWKRIEGSQKYLPAIPGRHVVWESKKWVELNAATWKARRRVHLILLNDHFLVAAEKKSRNDIGQTQDKRSATEWRASRCWPLQDVQVADLSPKIKPGGQEGKGTSANAINIRVGSESFTYAVYPGEEQNKVQLLATYRKAVEDLRKSQEMELEERGRAQDSYNYFATRDANILRKTDLMESLSDNVANQRASMFVDIEGKQQSIRAVENQLDELDIDIALQNFDSAVKKVEKLKVLAKSVRGNAMAQSIVTFKVNERATKLANVLIKQLVSTNNWITSVRQHVTWITRLGYEDRAREAYLDARGDLIKMRSRQCVFEGNLPDYIFQISFIYFTIIKNTVDIYQKCFSQILMSACVKWAKEHVDAFNVVLRRQLSSVDESGPLWEECMSQAREHAAMLREVGLDFSELVGTGPREEEQGQGPIGLGVS